MKFFSRLYEQRLEKIILKDDSSLPTHIVLIITESDLLETGSPDRILDFITWCRKYSINTLTIYVSLIDLYTAIMSQVYNELVTCLTDTLQDVDAGIDLLSFDGKIENVKKSETSGMQINISLGYSGKKELTAAFREIMFEVRSGKLKPGDIDGASIERHLLIKYEPDLVIRSGGKRLADFLIWQSVYSEIYFTDVSWINLRKLDFLRALRDYQKRQRRFGK
ncbi:MAG: Tritrans,polycis-undecaprenyl-diphosphate synthase (GGDP specific) [ANME-2 cluster archaeon]|nr:Tritrans,polycis-undecaprenyl-diphosphate synthase (GGDP specific) [ANME-2 cluster archaeon]